MSGHHHHHHRHRNHHHHHCHDDHHHHQHNHSPPAAHHHHPKNGFFEIATVAGVGLADAAQDDLSIFTTSPDQRILLGCGEGTLSQLSIGVDGLVLNAPFDVASLSTSNLTVASSIRASSLTTSDPSMTLQSYSGPMNIFSVGSTTLSVATPKADGALHVRVADREAVTVKANGYVGIGTAAPASTLDVGGVVSVNGVQVIGMDRSLSASSATVAGSASFGGGALALDSLRKTLIVSSEVSTFVDGTLAVDGAAAFGAGASVSGGDLKVSLSNGTSFMVQRSTGRVGVGSLAPRSTLDVPHGSVMSSVGTLGPTLTLVPPIGFSDVSSGAFFDLDGSIEPGNPGGAMLPHKPFFGSGSMLAADLSGEQASWARIRFVLRGVLMAPSAVPPNTYSTMNVFRWDAINAIRVLVTSFRLVNAGQDKGYSFFLTPWVKFDSADLFYSLQHVAQDDVSKFRISSIHAQFA